MGRVPPTPGLIRVDDDGGDNNDQYDIKALLPPASPPPPSPTTIINSEFVLLELVIMILKGIFMVILKIRKAQISI